MTTAGLLMLSSASAQAEATTLAEFAPGTFLENLVVRPDGATVFTSYFARELGVLEGTTSPSRLATLPAHPVGILDVGDSFVVTAHGLPFTDGTEFTSTQQILLINADGMLSDRIDIPDALFLNGLVQLSTGAILIADSIAGTLWRFDPEARAVSPWLTHELLAPNPDLPVFAPGANGLKQDGDRLLVSNSGRGMLYEIALDDAGNAASAPSPVAETGAIDDFTVQDGRIVFTTHGDALMAVEPNGTLSTLMARGCGGCTSVAVNGDSFVILTTGGLLEGHSDPARILSLPIQ